MPEGDGERCAVRPDLRRSSCRAHGVLPAPVPGDLVDDVMADVYVTAWRRIEHIPAGSELPWLYGVARNVVANQQRSFGRRSRLVVRVRVMAVDSTASGRGMEGDQTVLNALATLSASDQELLRLRAWEELSSAEIAVVLGITASAVDMRLSRARRRFERALHVGRLRPPRAGDRLAEEGSS